MTEQNQELSKYNEQFRAIREKAGLEHREFGELIGLRARTVWRIEAGTIKLPEDVYFYEALLKMPNVNEDDINTLLGSEGAPKRLTRDG